MSFKSLNDLFYFKNYAKLINKYYNVSKMSFKITDYLFKN